MNNKFLPQIGRLAQRYPFCSGCIVVAILLLAASQWLRLNLSELAARQQESAREGDRMLKFIARGAELRTAFANVHAAMKRINRNLVVEKNIPDNFWYFYKIEQDTHAKLVELQQRPAVLPDSDAPKSYKRIPYSLTLNGSFRAVISAFQQVEFGPRFARIDSFQMQRQDPASSNIALQLELELLGSP